MIIPELVERNFSRHPKYYDANAGIQKMVAANLADLISASIAAQSVSSALEIGCGTGFLTESLFRAFPAAEFTVTDISPAMLAYCERSTANLADGLGVSANFAVFDASSDSLEGTFDLVASSLAFQWVENFSGLTRRLRSIVATGGVLAFATLAEGTFDSISRIFSEHGLDFPIPKLPKQEELKNSLTDFTVREFRVETMREDFGTTIEFLRHLRGVGAGNATEKRLSTARFAKFLRERGKEPVSAEYEVVFAVGTAV